MLWLKANSTTEINLSFKLLSRLSKLYLTAFAIVRPLLHVTKMQVSRFTLILSKLSLQGAHNNSCELSGLLIIDKNVELAIRKQKSKIVQFALNAILAFSPASLLQNTIVIFKRDSH